MEGLMDGPARVIFEIFKKLLDFFFMQAYVWLCYFQIYVIFLHLDSCMHTHYRSMWPVPIYFANN